MGLIYRELVDRHEKDSIMDVVEPDAIDRVRIDWVCTVIGTTTLVVVVDSTPMVDDQKTQVIVPIHDEMNRI